MSGTTSRSTWRTTVTSPPSWARCRSEAAASWGSLGTSTAGGYVTPDGRITPWLNEIAFVPIDYRHDAPRDEWSGDHGCCVQYLSQQAAGRLFAAA